MVKVKIEGATQEVVSIIGELVKDGLSGHGIKVSHWTDVKQREIGQCTRKANYAGSTVLLLEMHTAH